MSSAAAFAADGWDADSPGTLALVIGVSRYPHLAPDPEGEPAAHNKYGLSELHVSALTAYRFAAWLRESYRYSASPLVRCWLLASPTDEELQEEPGLAAVAEPTFRNCEDAIWDWYSTALRLPAAHAQNSRLVLFYSGHGLARNMDEQLLLPSDYLERGLVNRAINVQDLRQALAACGVPQQLFLIDACRSDHPLLRDLGFSLTGTQVLNPVDSSRALPNLDSPVLYGTSSGQQAFAPRTVRDGLTLFGQALLSGLTAPPADSLERDSEGCVMVAHQLQKYMNARIAELLLTYGSDGRQSVSMGGQSVGAFVVSELACDSAVPNDPPSVRESEQKGRTASVAFADAASGQFVGDDQGEDPFGDPVMAQLWSQRRLRLSDDANGAMPQLTLVRVDRRGTSLYDIVFRIDSDPRASVLTLAAEAQDASHAFDCHLPWLGPGALHSLHLTRDDAGAIVHVAADLDLQNTSLLGRTAEAWRAYREESATVAAGLLSDDMLTPVVDGAEPSPLPVIIGCFLRLLAGRPIDRAWLEKVVVVWPRWSDPTVLLVESVRQQRGPSVDVTALASLPVPQTAGVMALAWRLLSDHRNDGPASVSGADLDVRLSRIMPWAQAGSMFPVILTPAPKTDAST